MQTNPLWDNDELQFARLIAEAELSGAFTGAVMQELQEEMDLTEGDIHELLERAQRSWDIAKARARREA
jgi:hypothetical protein